MSCLGIDATPDGRHKEPVPRAFVVHIAEDMLEWCYEAVEVTWECFPVVLKTCSGRATDATMSDTGAIDVTTIDATVTGPKMPTRYPVDPRWRHFRNFS